MTSIVRIHGLQRVVTAREQRLVRTWGDIPPLRVELRLPEVRLVRLVADDDVLHGRERARHLLLEGDESGSQPLGDEVTAVAVPGWIEKATCTPRTAAAGRSVLIWYSFSIAVGRAGSHVTGSLSSRRPTSFITPR